MNYSKYASQAYNEKHFATARFYFKLAMNDETDCAYNSPFLMFSYADTCLECGMYDEADALFSQLSESTELSKFLIALCGKKRKRIEMLNAISPALCDVTSDSFVLASVITTVCNTFKFIRKPIIARWFDTTTDFFNLIAEYSDDIYSDDLAYTPVDYMTLPGEKNHYLFVSSTWTAASVDAFIGLIAHELCSIELMDNYFFHHIQSDEYNDPIHVYSQHLITDFTVLSKGFGFELLSARQFMKKNNLPFEFKQLSPQEIVSFFYS